MIDIALRLVLAIQAFLFKPYRIPSATRLPELHVGQRVLVNPLSSRFNAPYRGEVVVFHPPAGRGNEHIQRPRQKPQRASARPATTKLRGSTAPTSTQSSGPLSDPL